MPDHSQQQTKVIIASSLKSVKDIRAWAKLGISLRETSKYELNIIGFSTKKMEKYNDVNFYSSGTTGRRPLDRIKSMLRFSKLVLQIRPQLLICCTYEYLPIARFFKKAIGYKLVYDVQENYVANLDLNPKLSPKKRGQLTKLIQRMEQPSGIDLFLLAETCYQKEMPEKSPFLILENKFSGEIKHSLPKNFSQKKQFKFLISGTISPAYGTSEAIQWFQKINEFFPGSRLQICGHVPLSFYQKEIEKLAENNPSIHLELSEFPVPYEELFQKMQQSDFLLLPYQGHPAFQNKIPTKLFDSAALGIPVLISPNPNWQTFLNTHQSGSSIDFSNQEFAKQEFLDAVSKTYFSKTLDESLLWSSQKQRFIDAIHSLLSE